MCSDNDIVRAELEERLAFALVKEKDVESAKEFFREALARKKADPYDARLEFCERWADALEAAEADLVVLAGFLTIFDEQVYERFTNKIINVHPALIPSFCGKGYYGLHVHEAALQKGVKVSGATVHIVTPECDAGPIILQKAVEVRQDDTPESLQLRIMEEAEWKILPLAVKLFCDGKITIKDNKAYISE
jgi:phosphoribosylglycinamide formyltransferase-1